ncbi:MAG TPA: hypothetical protein VGD94_22290 [Vicinamibacterales bacterium]
MLAIRPLIPAAALVLTCACVSTPLRQIPPAIPEAGENVTSNAANGGRVQSIAVNPTNRNNAIIAMQFGGMWRTFNAGETWFRIYTLPAVYVTDVEFGADGRTAVATVFRDTQTQPGGGGGIYISRSNGDFWARPATGIVPAAPWMSGPTSAHSVSRAPDERGLWYVGTDAGVAVSRDDGDTWTHKGVGGTSAVQSVLAFPGGTVLAMDSSHVWRSDDRGETWRAVIDDTFSQFAPANGNVGPSGNKMDRSPHHPWAFIIRDYHPAPKHGSGKLWFYELDTGTKTPLALPQGRSRGPFVRVSRDELHGGNHIRLWVGTGWDGYYVIREDAASIRALQSTPTFDDWVSFIAEAGIHADMGDLGLDASAMPAFMGTDGGIYKPRVQDKWWEIGGQHKWVSAAVPGSGMNSLQISDLAGTNIRLPNGDFTTSLYFTTQDNALYTSPDGGATWKVGDPREGFGLDGRSDANAGEAAQIVFVGIGGSQDTFADLDVTNKRPVPPLDENGVSLDGFQNPYFVNQQPNSNASNWVRRRVPTSAPLTEVYFSNNSGENWRKFATVNFKFAGEVRTVGPVAWLPVFLGGSGNPIGLVPLATATPPGLPPPTYDDSDVVRLPGSGSLGQRFTEFDKHAIYAVHPTNWAYLITADIVANDMKITRDGGKTWHTSAGLTAQVRRGGALDLWGGKADLMQVTEIAFDPYNPGRILVGTRDAGLICTADDGRTWRTIYLSDRIKYITGFHFQPNGRVYISSYGTGLWQLRTSGDCGKTYRHPWDVSDPVVGEISDVAVPEPRGISAPGRQKLFVVLQDADVEAGSHQLSITGRGFNPGETITLQCREVQTVTTRVRIDERGQFAVTLPLPATFPAGDFTIQGLGPAGEALTASEFRKPLADDAPDRPGSVRQQRQQR